MRGSAKLSAAEKAASEHQNNRQRTPDRDHRRRHSSFCSLARNTLLLAHRPSIPVLSPFHLPTSTVSAI